MGEGLVDEPGSLGLIGEVDGDEVEVLAGLERAGVDEGVAGADRAR